LFFSDNTLIHSSESNIYTTFTKVNQYIITEKQ